MTADPPSPLKGFEPPSAGLIAVAPGWEIQPLFFGGARLYRLAPGDVWDYEGPVAAIEALIRILEETDEEPTGWIRHPATGRRRPGGDQSQEYVWH